MEVVPVVNQKGGVCKSSTALNLATALAEVGARPLLVDCDPQGHSSLYCGMREDEPRYGSRTYQALQFPRLGIDELAQTTPYGFDILAGGPDVTSAEDSLLKLDKLEVFRDKLSALPPDRYTHVFIDCPPSVSALTLSALVAASYMIMPFTPESSAIDGIGLLLKAAKSMERFNAQGTVPLLGVVMVREGRKTRHQRSVEAAVEEALPGKLFTQRIREATCVNNAVTAMRPVLAYEPKHDVCTDIRVMAQEFLARTAAGAKGRK